MAYYVWRLRRRAAGQCTGPYVGAAVGTMYGPCRRRVSGDAAVAWVVVCTVARPLVRILSRGGVCDDILDVGAIDIVIRVPPLVAHGCAHWCGAGCFGAWFTTWGQATFRRCPN